MNTAESAFVAALSELEVAAKAAKSKLHPRNIRSCVALPIRYMRKNKELKLALLKEVEDEIADDATQLQYSLKPLQTMGLGHFRAPHFRDDGSSSSSSFIHLHLHEIFMKIG